MRSAPYRLAFFGICITVARIAMLILVIDSGFGLILSKIFAGAFAIFIAVGVYVSSFFVRHEKTRLAGLAGLILFGLGDLWFNEATVVYYTSSANLVAPSSNFLGIGATYLTYVMQATALGFGGIPTLGAAVLGWMQAGASQIAEFNRPGLFSRISVALGKIVTGWGVAVAVRFESSAKRSLSESDGNLQEVSTSYDWRLLTDSQKAKLAGRSVAEIRQMYSGIPERTALNWYNRANQKQLTESQRK